MQSPACPRAAHEATARRTVTRWMIVKVANMNKVVHNGQAGLVAGRIVQC